MTERASGETDLIKLYSQRILALTTEMPLTDRLEAPDATVRRRAPLCGSTVTVDVTVENGAVTGYGQEVKACALGQAAAAIVGGAVIGRDHAELARARDQLRAMLAENGPVPDAPFEGFEVLQPARDYRNRHASILLAIEAVTQAVEEVGARRSATG
ncbi:iron-sulfur cluster assembly scaffold protein [Limimaricola cinnabarinus]|jgi:NifU-like protein involved in Fe-S cluster formation|uniref:Putative iron-sulfur cluster assembly scaffold protein for SUF system, SufE2 n=2 Tax=Limimaricola cinnabarinus TaxID=1125964 RepID=U3AFV5_9RHOB|nr:iron-sulfur cluster assembly scaffold protein [Limimaricola cinnabarinus]GAD56564.1 putative iron-sulfur cluster assembly scaffold protein for SUF system, SufE2 [Limimaricola cinnabarinus LL-001]